MSTPLPEQQLPPVKIAFVIDGKVVDILHTDERLGAIFLSEPLIIDASEEKDQNGNFNLRVGANYDSQTEKFTNPIIEK